MHGLEGCGMRIASVLPGASGQICKLGIEDCRINHECGQPPSIRSLPRLASSNLGEGVSAAGKSICAVDGVLLAERKAVAGGLIWPLAASVSCSQTTLRIVESPAMLHRIFFGSDGIPAATERIRP